MKIRNLLCVGVAAITVVGCAAQTMAPGGGPRLADAVCGEQPCQVVVKVTGHPISNPPVRIEVSIPTLAVQKGTRPQMVWVLHPESDPGFSFRVNSITPHTGASNPTTGKGTTTQAAWDAEFTRDASSTPTRVVINNRNTTQGTPRLYYYDVKVFHIRTGDQAFTLDPAILNDF